MIDYSLASKLKTAYKSAHPFPYVVIDNFIPDYLLNRALTEIKNHDYWYHNTMEWIKEYEVNKLYTPNHDTNIPELKKQIPYTSLIIDYFNTPEFLGFLRELTGHENLYCDDTLMGGGIHKINNGGKLSIHTDYNEHPVTGHLRKLNLLLYMNHDWKDEYNGHLELWEKDFSREVVKIAPVFNRVVIFDIENAPHGHVVPLSIPNNISRYSLALYYFLPKVSEEPKTVFFSNDDYIFQMTRLK